MRKALKILTWVLMVVALVLFWLSLRSTEGNFEYTLYALGAVTLGWISNYFLKKYEKETED